MSNDSSAVDIWRKFHWTFFIHTQGLIIALGRFEMAVQENDLSAAKLELKTASDLLRASGASMELAGSYTRHEYENEVRPSMEIPKVSEDNFSGLMSWDHSSLIRLWKRLQPVFHALPKELKETHEDFIDAYRDLAASHRAVCKRFGGDQGGSLKNETSIAVDVLDRFEVNRESLLTSNRGCPVSHGG
ncbi:MAG: siderophore biosynthesis protein [Planctomycetota bacterium]